MSPNVARDLETAGFHNDLKAFGRILTITPGLAWETANNKYAAGRKSFWRGEKCVGCPRDGEEKNQ